MFYTIYKITNSLNGKFYIGQHKTDNLNDGYMGSGTLLRAYMKKIGKENFTKEILHIFDNFEDMDNKEAEIVNEEFIKREDTMNIALGGSTGIAMPNMVVARPKGSNEKYQFIDKLHYYENRNSYEVPISNSLAVKTETGGYQRINSKDYDPTRHFTSGRGRISVYDLITGGTKGISKEEFDPNVHKSVFGGKVIKDENGVIRYATEEDSNNVAGIHKGKITAIEISTGVKKHVTSEEFYGNPEKYTHLTKGKTYGKHKETGEVATFDAGSITEEIKKTYTFSTTGQRTVYVIETKEWKNIPKDEYDSTKHRSCQDVKLKFHTPHGIYEFWGSKADFLKKYKLPKRIWDQCVLTHNGVFYTTGVNNSKWNGSHIKLENWK